MFDNTGKATSFIYDAINNFRVKNDDQKILLNFIDKIVDESKTICRNVGLNISDLPMRLYVCLSELNYRGYLIFNSNFSSFKLVPCANTWSQIYERYKIENHWIVQECEDMHHISRAARGIGKHIGEEAGLYMNYAEIIDRARYSDYNPTAPDFWFNYGWTAELLAQFMFICDHGKWFIICPQPIDLKPIKERQKLIDRARNASEEFSKWEIKFKSWRQTKSFLSTIYSQTDLGGVIASNINVDGLFSLLKQWALNIPKPLLDLVDCGNKLGIQFGWRYVDCETHRLIKRLVVDNDLDNATVLMTLYPPTNIGRKDPKQWS